MDYIEFARGKMRQTTMRTGIQMLVEDSYCASHRAGWHSDPRTGEPLPIDIPLKLVLIHSEISEALEGHRKGKPDDHLPHRPAFEVEMADALIRILDLAGATKIDLAGAYIEKRAYNDRRPDHKREARLAAGGKAF